MGDTISAILSRPIGSRARAALFVGITADASRWHPLRIGLGGIQDVAIVRGTQTVIERQDASLVLRIADARLSERHARLTRLGGRWILEDLASKNGTWIGGRAIRQHTLEESELVEIGHTFILFRATGGDDTPPARAFPGLATLSTPLADRLDRIARLAPSSVPVLIGGETGTGKEVVARGVHELSGRRGPFVAVNCGAIASTLVEAELFGHRKGAFTGAGDERAGLVRSADGGTLFLDEIGELPPPAQAALLRVLQEGEVTQIGADAPVRVDLRIVAATLRDLEHDVAMGRFRADLLGRLLGATITLPPLRDRLEDLALVVATLLARLAPGRALRLTPDASRALYAYGWPRNVRELERALAAACELARGMIDLEHLPDAVAASAPARTEVPLATLSAADRATRDELATALLRHDGNVAAVARELGRDRTQIRRWMRRFGLSRPADDE